MSSGKQFYSDEEAEEILRLAVSKSSSSGGLTRAQLLASASELGVPPEAVEEAELEMLGNHAETTDRARFNKSLSSEFVAHLGTYLAVNIGLGAINFLNAGRLSWALYPIIGWGILLAMIAVDTFSRGVDYEKSFAKWQRKQKQKQARNANQDVRGAIEDISGYIDTEEDKIEAIRELRLRTGMDLKDSKDAIDEHNRQSQR